MPLRLKSVYASFRTAGPQPHIDHWIGAYALGDQEARQVTNNFVLTHGDHMLTRKGVCRRKKTAMLSGGLFRRTASKGGNPNNSPGCVLQIGIETTPIRSRN